MPFTTGQNPGQAVCRPGIGETWMAWRPLLGSMRGRDITFAEEITMEELIDQLAELRGRIDALGEYL